MLLEKIKYANQLDLACDPTCCSIETSLLDKVMCFSPENLHTPRHCYNNPGLDAANRRSMIVWRQTGSSWGEPNSYSH